MKGIFGLILVLAGLAVGLYVGVYLCFIGGIVGIVNAVKAPAPVDAIVFAWNIAKIFFSGVVGIVSAIMLMIPGVAMIALWLDRY